MADRLGYHRWAAEHHGTPMLVGAAPEAVIGAIAATTAGIRVGSGGVMLHHYSPRKVAETLEWPRDGGHLIAWVCLTRREGWVSEPRTSSLPRGVPS